MYIPNLQKLQHPYILPIARIDSNKFITMPAGLGNILQCNWPKQSSTKSYISALIIRVLRNIEPVIIFAYHSEISELHKFRHNNSY